MRLAPELRRQQILDAALVEFSTLGYAAASISKIAQRAGTSNSNLYVHFANKDEIFASLLESLLVPSRSVWMPLQAGQDVGELIDAYVDQLFAGLTPSALAIIRLLVSDGHRIPQLIQRWYEKAVRPAQVEQQRRIDQYVAAGYLPPSPLGEHFGFVMAPVLYAAVFRLVFGEDTAEAECRQMKATLRAVLRQLLAPVTSTTKADQPRRRLTR